MTIKTIHQKIVTIVGVCGVLAILIILIIMWKTKANKADLYLSFDDGSGYEIADDLNAYPETKVNYLYDHAIYKENEEPQWRQSGVSNGSLLFDGNSTYISYDPEIICASGELWTVNVWVAPRMFEWDNPNAENNGTEALTSIISQYNADKKQGILLGYERYGKLCFKVGTGDSWYKLWSDDARLQKYQWNQVTAVFDGKNGSMKLYLNGEEIANKRIKENCAIAPADKEKFLIGKNSKAEAIAAGTYNMFSGLMDELKIYSLALEEKDITVNEIPEVKFEDIWMQNLLQDDVYKTQYHGGPYQFWMNEPHAPIYYNGMYHLFYQNNMGGTYWRNICWGHLVSTDMVNWIPIKEAITPTENSVVPDGVWSGGATTDVNGVPVLFFTAGNDSFADYGLISNQNIGVAYPKNLSDQNLTDWVMSDELAVIQQEGMGRIGEFRDPSIWKEGNMWCMLICSGSTASNGGSVLLYETDTLEVCKDGSVNMNWEYKGPIYEMENQSPIYGSSWELPILLPLTNEEGTAKKYIFMISPAPASTADNKVYYFIGDFDVATGKFTPDESFMNAPKLFDYGTNVFTGPSAFVDSLSGDVCMFSIMQDQRDGAEERAAGWAHCVGLTRKIWLNDNGTDVKMSPISNIDNLEKDVLIQEENITIEEANELLQDVNEDLYHMELNLELNDTENITLKLKSDLNHAGVELAYDAVSQTITGFSSDTGKAASMKRSSGLLEIQDGCVNMDVYVDRSLIEAFFNETKSLSIRSYGDANNNLIILEGDEKVTIKKLCVTSMNSIYQ